MKRYKKNIVIILAIFLGSISVFLAIRNVKISKIECTNQFGECDEAIKDTLAEFTGFGYFEAKEKINEHLVNNISIDSYNVQDRFPNTLKVNLIRLVPAFGIYNSSLATVALIDRSGKVLSIESVTNVPTIETASNLPQVGDYVTAEQLFALNFIYDIVTTAKVNYARLNEDNLEFEYEDGIKVIVPLVGDKEVLVGSLILIKSQLNSAIEESKIGQERQFHEIDLRYKNPILR